MLKTYDDYKGLISGVLFLTFLILMIASWAASNMLNLVFCGFLGLFNLLDFKFQNKN